MIKKKGEKIGLKSIEVLDNLKRSGFSDDEVLALVAEIAIKTGEGDK